MKPCDLEKYHLAAATALADAMASRSTITVSELHRAIVMSADPFERVPSPAWLTEWLEHNAQDHGLVRVRRGRPSIWEAAQEEAAPVHPLQARVEKLERDLGALLSALGVAQ